MSYNEDLRVIVRKNGGLKDSWVLYCPDHRKMYYEHGPIEESIETANFHMRTFHRKKRSWKTLWIKSC